MKVWHFKGNEMTNTDLILKESIVNKVSYPAFLKNQDHMITVLNSTSLHPAEIAQNKDKNLSLAEVEKLH